MSRCKIIATRKPTVWKDGDEWICDQDTKCLTCGEVNFDVIALAATWDGAMSASRDAREVVGD